MWRKLTWVTETVRDLEKEKERQREMGKSCWKEEFIEVESGLVLCKNNTQISPGLLFQTATAQQFWQHPNRLENMSHARRSVQNGPEFLY